MKKLIYITISLFIASSALALEFEKGAEVPDIHPRLLRKLLIQGKTNYQGNIISIAAGAAIPSRFQKKWDEIKLSGGDIPKTGTAGPKTILIKSF
jgi:hypothetical protein